MTNVYFFNHTHCIFIYITFELHIENIKLCSCIQTYKPTFTATEHMKNLDLVTLISKMCKFNLNGNNKFY